MNLHQTLIINEARLFEKFCVILQVFLLFPNSLGSFQTAEFLNYFMTYIQFSKRSAVNKSKISNEISQIENVTIENNNNYREILN